MKSAALSVAAFVAVSAYAHHNPAAHYIVDQTITVAGVVTEFRLVNPHARIYLEVTDDNGQKKTWMAEGDSAISLGRKGWTADRFQAGDFITVIGHPARDGSNLIEWITISLPDGSDVFGGNGQMLERNRVFEMRLEQYRREQAERD
jgi:hypothetical protein